MSDTLSETTDEVASVALRPSSHRPGRRRGVIAIGVVVALVAIAAGLWVTDPFAGPKATAPIASDPTSLATVTRQSLSSQTQVNATLGYSGTYTVVVPSAGAASQGGSSQGGGGGQQASGQAAGTFTALPAAGQVVVQGQPLYSVSLTPVALLYGATPVSRTLSEGLSGADVAQLNADLVSLGDASKTDLDPSSDYFSAATAAGVEKLQSNLGVDPDGHPDSRTGGLSPDRHESDQCLGHARGSRPARLDRTCKPLPPRGRSSPSSTPTSSPRSSVGDKVTITLPSNQTTPGVVSKVGTVATTPSSGGSNGGGSASGSSGGSGGTPTIEVDITPSDPAATGALDQAPVTVTITTATVNDAARRPRGRAARSVGRPFRRRSRRCCRRPSSGAGHARFV